MNRRQKIIVSVTGIFLVLLILLGLTYAYFLTKIKGNDNEKSISVTTANLELVYGDGNALITAEKIEPGDSITAKTFTVTNSGNATINNYAVYLEELVNNLERTSDMVYTLTCTSSVTNSTCNGKTETVFPTQNGILVTNNIAKDEVQTYSLQLTYKEMNVDQSVDMGKEVSAKVQIYNLRDIVDITGTVTGASEGDYVELHSNPKKSQINNNTYTIPGVEPGSHTIYLKDKDGTVLGQKDITINKGETAGVSGTTIITTEDSQTVTINLTKTSSDFTINLDNVKDYNPFEDGTLANAIYTSAKTKANGTEFLETPKTKPAEETSAEDEKVLNVTPDDYGTSYYFRGNVIDNYVNFAGMCWRAVRIAGDGSIKLILEDQDETCSETMNGNWNIPTTTGGTTKTGNFGYTQHEAKTLTASDGTQNSSTKYLMNYLNGGTNKDKSMATAFKNFQTGPLANYLDKLKAGDWCLNDKAYATSSDNTTALTNQEVLDNQVNDVNDTSFYYDSYVRLSGKTKKEPTLKCNGTVMTKFADENNTDMYVGTLTADEIVYAGGKVGSSNTDYYLINDYQQSNGLYFWSLSPYDFVGSYDYAFDVGDDGYLSHDFVNDNFYSRPSITLIANAQISSGDGTISNPYVIE